jgi:hypothetical protein
VVITQPFVGIHFVFDFGKTCATVSVCFCEATYDLSSVHEKKGRNILDSFLYAIRGEER